MNIRAFQKEIWNHYYEHKRDFPWRRTKDPYRILVSEIMLQQTQAPRVAAKYRSFLKKFPDLKTLAEAKTAEVLQEWQGLGYNRRALYLKRCAEAVVKEHNGKFPRDFKKLCALPGIGPATAGDLMAFAWNLPVPLIETNIRTVFIHFFFKSRKKVNDKEIMPLIGKTLDKGNPREWYWALFDYGAFLKQGGNPSRRSAHHVRQSKFEGSYRQKRAKVLRSILENSTTVSAVQIQTGVGMKELKKIMEDLEKEGFVKSAAGKKWEIA